MRRKTIWSLSERLLISILEMFIFFLNSREMPSFSDIMIAAFLYLSGTRKKRCMFSLAILFLVFS